MQIDSKDLLDRFLRYVQIDTRSDPHSEATPSTPCQWDLLKLLQEELRGLGATEISLSPEGYLLATIPATVDKPGVPTLAWFAHVDTAPNLPSAAKPIVHRAYDGRTLSLPDDPSQVLSLENCAQLKHAIGKDLITASGKTLLGADDKAGVAAILSAARHLLQNPSIPHGKIRLCFNPDEEIARGVTKLELASIGADYAYTLDGESLGEINYETFSADAAELEIRGVASHPGSAKDVMVNALRLAGRFLASLPMDRSPEKTCERQGFIHPVEMEGTSENARVRLILRDFELAGLSSHRATLEELVATLRREEPRAEFKLSFHEQYRNMRYWLEKDMRPVEFAQEACRRAGLNPFFVAIRGGTDGSNLTARGLLAPNIFTGMHCLHSEREWVCLQDMEKAAEVLVHLAQVCAQK